jgi:hypothetical protein
MTTPTTTTTFSKHLIQLGADIRSVSPSLNANMAACPKVYN